MSIRVRNVNRRILIEGIGGIGGLVAAYLLKAGYLVDLITNNLDITKAINSEGIILKKNGSTENIKTQAYTSLDDLPQGVKYEIIFLIMKANGVLDAGKKSLDYLTPDGYMATFQNGIVEEKLTLIVGKEKVIPVTVGFGGIMLANGIYEKTSTGGFHIGELTGNRTNRIVELKEILTNVDKVVISDNMIGILWSKLAINCTINTLGAITGQTLGELLSSREIRDLFLGIYREVVEVAHAVGITLEPVATNPYRLYLPIGAGKFTKFSKDILVRIVGRKYRNLRSSTLQSIERGRKSEIDFLNGFVVMQAEKRQISVPMNRVLTKIMNEIDSGQFTSNSMNINLIFAQLKNE